MGYEIINSDWVWNIFYIIKYKVYLSVLIKVLFIFNVVDVVRWKKIYSVLVI